MPVVPFSPVSKARPAQGPVQLSEAQEPWALMAAAQMDVEGRLMHRGEFEDRRNEKPEDIGLIVQYPGEKLPMHAVTKLGQDAGAQDLDNQLVDKWLKDRGK